MKYIIEIKKFYVVDCANIKNVLKFSKDVRKSVYKNDKMSEVKLYQIQKP